MTKVLLIDDDSHLTGVVGPALEEAGYQVEVADDGLDGIRRLYRWQPDLVILDVMMPRMDGWEVCHRIREVSDVPILMLTARDGEPCELKALDSGADLYITKPFTVRLLLARMNALLRRNRLSTIEGQSVVTVGDLRIDLRKREVRLDGRSVDLTPTEYRLLAALASKPGQVITHRELLAQVWGDEYVGEDLYLKLYVRYLRQKIEENPSEPRYILTKRGVGYSLTTGCPGIGAWQRASAL